MTDAELKKAAKEYRDLQVMIKELETEVESIKAAITGYMDAEKIDTVQADVFTIKYTAYTSSRIDTTALKKELPDIADHYTKTTEARRFQVM